MTKVEKLALSDKNFKGFYYGVQIALEMWKCAQINHDVADALRCMSKVFLKSGNYEMALKTAREALEVTGQKAISACR